MRQHVTLMLLLSLLLAAPTMGELSVQVDYGWGERLRAGRWTPVFVTLSDSPPRNVIINVHAPLDQHFSSSISQHVTIGPEPATFPILVPLSYSLDETSVSIRDARPPGRVLARRFLVPPGQGWTMPRQERFVDSGAAFIGITGNRSTVRLLQEQLQHPGVFADYLSPRRLPVTAAGYDGLNVLLLNQPQLAGSAAVAIGMPAQQAIAHWVRAGGILLVIPGADFAAEGPLAELLPAAAGDNIEITLEADQLSNAGLPDRFGRLNARQMQPRLEVERHVLLYHDQAVAYRHRVGFGEVVLLSFDAAGLQFRSSADAARFWKRALPTVDFSDPDASRRLTYQPEDQRKTVAVQHTMDLLGNVPGVGSFGFSYVALVMIGLMLLVGPVDWFVLKWTGRQPWTWATTAGWVGLITFGAIYIGTMVRSGEMHFRTLRVIDQVDGAVVAHHDFLGTYSNRSGDYRIETPQGGWWKPPASSGYWSRGGIRSDIRFAQDYRGNYPGALRIHIWNLRFLEAQRHVRAAAVVSADLRLEGQRLLGTMTSHAELPISEVVVRGGNRVWRIDGEIAPGSTVEVSAEPYTGRDLFAPVEHDFNTTPWRGHYGAWGEVPTRPAYAWSADLAIERSRRIETLLQNDRGLVAIYSTIENAPPAAELIHPDAREQHWQVIRALVPLRPAEGASP